MYLRRALRDEAYSHKLNVWIDLVFGSKQQSKKDYNLYFELACTCSLMFSFEILRKFTV